MILNTASGGPRHPFNAGRQYPGMMGEDFSESVGDHFSESGDDNISEWMGGFPRNLKVSVRSRTVGAAARWLGRPH
jgi:hypothetical protein